MSSLLISSIFSYPLIFSFYPSSLICFWSYLTLSPFTLLTILSFSGLFFLSFFSHPSIHLRLTIKLPSSFIYSFLLFSSFLVFIFILIKPSNYSYKYFSASRYYPTRFPLVQPLTHLYHSFLISLILCLLLLLLLPSATINSPLLIFFPSNPSPTSNISPLILPLF